jgi:hypothetical protein
LSKNQTPPPIKETETETPVQNEVIRKLKEDLTKKPEEALTRLDPPTASNFDEKLTGIICRLNRKKNRKQRTDHIQILEACFYLEQLKESCTEEEARQQKIRTMLLDSLGPRRTARTLKCAGRIFKIFQLINLSQLCYTEDITFTKLEALSEEDFQTLLEEVRIHGVHS